MQPVDVLSRLQGCMPHSGLSPPAFDPDRGLLYRTVMSNVRLNPGLSAAALLPRALGRLLLSCP